LVLVRLLQEKNRSALSEDKSARKWGVKYKDNNDHNDNNNDEGKKEKN
jgi:hypothetical protein